MWTHGASVTAYCVYVQHYRCVGQTISLYKLQRRYVAANREFMHWRIDKEAFSHGQITGPISNHNYNKTENYQNF